MVLVQNILQWLDSWAPFRYAESWDNCGLQVGNPKAPVNRVLVALDPGTASLSEARNLGCECIVTHHPLVLQPVRTIRTDSWPGSLIAQCIVCGINVIAVHTNVDVARDGTNAQLMRLLGLELIGPLEAEPGFSADELYLGMGVVGRLPRALAVRTFAAELKRLLGGVEVRITGDLGEKVETVAICSGSGGSLIGKVLASGADVFVTGDMKYHDGRLAEESGIAVIDIGHFASEILVLEPMAAFLRTTAAHERAEVEVFTARSEKDPFQVIA